MCFAAARTLSSFIRCFIASRKLSIYTDFLVVSSVSAEVFSVLAHSLFERGSSHERNRMCWKKNSKGLIETGFIGSIEEGPTGSASPDMNYPAEKACGFRIKRKTRQRMSPLKVA